MKEFATHPKHLMLALLLSLLAGCGGGSDPVIPKALTEHDFAADPSLRLDAGSVGVTFLESKGAAPATSGDTGLTGTDEFPLRIAEQTTFTYSIDTADKTVELVKMIRLAGNEEVFAINAARSRATVTLEPGDYKLIVYSSYTVAEANGETHRAVFLHDSTLAPAPVQAAMNTGVPRKSVLAVDTAKQILISTGRCIGCDLTSANLYGAYLPNANLANANLTKADLSSANMTKADLTNANLYGGYLRNANLDSANLINASLAWANLTNAILTNANLTNANLDSAHLGSANMTKADLTGAIWTDGRICAANSISSCK